MRRRANPLIFFGCGAICSAWKNVEYLLCVWILLQNASSHSCFSSFEIGHKTNLFFFFFLFFFQVLKFICLFWFLRPLNQSKQNTFWYVRHGGASLIVPSLETYPLRPPSPTPHPHPRRLTPPSSRCLTLSCVQRCTGRDPRRWGKETIGRFRRGC